MSCCGIISSECPHINIQDFREAVENKEIYVTTKENVDDLDNLIYEIDTKNAKIIVVYSDNIYVRLNSEWCVLCGDDGYYTKCVGIVDDSTEEKDFVNEGFSSVTKVVDCSRILIFDDENYQIWIKPNTSGDFRELVERNFECGVVTLFDLPTQFNNVSGFNYNLTIKEDCYDEYFDEDISGFDLYFKKDGLIKATLNHVFQKPTNVQILFGYRYRLNGTIISQISNLSHGATGWTATNILGNSNELIIEVSAGDYISPSYFGYQYTTTTLVSINSLLANLKVKFWEY